MTRKVESVLLLLGLFLAPGPAVAAHGGGSALPRDRVELRGSSAVEVEALRALLPDSLCPECARDTLEAALRSLHAVLGYFSPRVAEYRLSGTGDARRITLRVESGPLSRVGTIRLSGLPGLPERAFTETILTFQGRPASVRQVDNLLAAVVRAAAERGYPFCRADLAEAAPDSSGNICLYLRLEPGRHCLLGQVSLPGLKNTRPAVALRLTGLWPGQDYVESEVQAARGRLLRSGLFREVASPVVIPGVNPYRADLSLPVREWPSSTLLAALGSGGPSGVSGVSGFFRLELNNVLGTARRGAVAWEHPQRDWSSLELSWREPWLFGSGISLEAAYSQSLRDSLYTSSTGRLNLSLLSGDCLRLGLGGSVERVSPGSETWDLAERSSRWALSGSMERSDLLNPANPARGSVISVHALAGRRKIDGRSLREVRSDLSLRTYHSLGRAPHTAALAAGYSFVARGASTVSELPYHVRIPVGGSSRDGGPAVRGHPDEELRARRAAWLSLEYRYLTGPAGRLFLFYDLCAAQSPDGQERLASETLSWKVRTLQGYGAGLLLESRLGILSLAFALQPGRGPGDARLHLSLSESF